VISDELEAGNLMASDSHNMACILLLRNHNELRAAEASRGHSADGGSGGDEGSGGEAPGAEAKSRRKAPKGSAPRQDKVKGHVSGSSADGQEQPIFCEVLDTRTQKLIASHPTLGKSCHFLVRRFRACVWCAGIGVSRADLGVAENLSILQPVVFLF
jgi:hypothetical protein